MKFKIILTKIYTNIRLFFTYLFYGLKNADNIGFNAQKNNLDNNIGGIEQQAEEFNHSIKREFCFLFTHGLVHLLGLDHKTKEDEEKFNNIVYDVINAEKIYR